MAKPNYQRKAEVIANGDYQLYRYSMQAQYAFFRRKSLRKENPFKTVKDAIEYHNSKLQENPDNFKECERLDNARVQRVKRLRSRIRYMVENYECNFVTLTFSDETLNSTNADTRHRYVMRWLKDNFPCAVANVDYGAKNGREHYHAIVPVPKVNHETWQYGMLYGKTIPKGDKNNADKLSHYVAKLVNHAIKETTKGCRTIYSGVFGHVDLTVERTKTQNKEVLASQEENAQDNFMVLSDEDVTRLDDIFLKGFGV